MTTRELFFHYLVDKREKKEEEKRIEKGENKLAISCADRSRLELPDGWLFGLYANERLSLVILGYPEV